MVGMRDVAKRAGVSLSSVSLVVNGNGYVSDSLRERVERAMRELDYVPNELARNLFRDRTGLVGIIVPTVAHPFFAELTDALQRDLAIRGMRTMLCATAAARGGEAQYVDLLKRHAVDALVVASHTMHDANFWTSIGRPVVAFDRWLGDGISQVRSDHEQGGKLIADIVVGTSSRHVVMVGGPRGQFDDLGEGRSTFPTVRYMQTLEDRLDMFGIRHDYIDGGEVDDLPRACAAVRDAFDRFGTMDMLVASDAVAAFAVQEALSRGVDVPGRLQVIAYDGTPVIHMAGKPLTAIRQDFPTIAHAIGTRVNAQIDGTALPDAIIPVSVHQAATTRVHS